MVVARRECSRNKKVYWICDAMKPRFKTIQQLKKEAKERGYGVRAWARIAELDYQVIYRRLNNPESLRVDEYLRLASAVEKMRNGTDRLPA